jgi:hypothetical protein
VTNIEAYILEAESQGVKHCTVPTEALIRLLEVAEAAKSLLKDISRTVDVSLNWAGSDISTIVSAGNLNKFCLVLEKLDESRRS